MTFDKNYVPVTNPSQTNNMHIYLKFSILLATRKSAFQSDMAKPAGRAGNNDFEMSSVEING